MRRIVILRPQPGADLTAQRALALGLEPVVAPIFEVASLAWSPPEAIDFDAVMLTSANAPLHGGPGLDAFLDLPCYTVGETTAAAARARGFTDVHVGTSDAAALAGDLRSDNRRKVLHFCGRDVVPGDVLPTQRVPVYEAVPVHLLPNQVDDAISEGALVLIHSPRAAVTFAELGEALKPDTDILTISTAAAEAAGDGWRSVFVADAPRDTAMLELAARLCQNVPLGAAGEA